MINYFIRNDVLLKNPVSRVKFLKEDNEQTRVVSPDEERLYLLACSQPPRDVATVMIETGMRPDEVYRLERRNVQLDKGFIFNPYGKTKAARRKLPLSQRAVSVLRRRLEKNESNLYFRPRAAERIRPDISSSLTTRIMQQSNERELSLSGCTT